MGKRRELRTAISLPVSLSGLDPDGNAIVQRATTVDLSQGGACVRVMGLRTVPGAIFNLVYQGKRAKYRVVWIGEKNTPRANEIGMTALDASQCIWDLPTSAFWRDEYEPAPVKAESGSAKHSEEIGERRQFPRIKCNGSAKLIPQDSSSFPIGGRVSDISMGGCYVETHLPVPIDDQLNFELSFAEGVIRGRGTVRASHPGVGMGLRFNSLGEGSVSILERLITGSSGEDVVIRVKLESVVFSRLCELARREQCSAEEIASHMLKEYLEGKS